MLPSLRLHLPAAPRNLICKLCVVGAPVALTPFEDDPTLGVDPERNNNFDYESTQEKCPFAAHSRKMFPRSDLTVEQDKVHRIIRRAIAYGPELSQEEIDSKSTINDRGLLFVSYQSNIENGFQFLQKCKHLAKPSLPVEFD